MKRKFKGILLQGILTCVSDNLTETIELVLSLAFGVFLSNMALKELLIFSLCAYFSRR